MPTRGICSVYLSAFAQLVEPIICNDGVVGPKPISGPFFPNKQYVVRGCVAANVLRIIKISTRKALKREHAGILTAGMMFVLHLL